MEDDARPGIRRDIRPLRYCIAAVAIFLGFAATPMQGLAWADPTVSGSTSTETVHTSPADRADSDKRVDTDKVTEDAAPATDSRPDRQDEPDTAAADGSDPGPYAGISEPGTDDSPETTGTLTEVADHDEPESTLEDHSEPEEPTTPEVVTSEPDTSITEGDATPWEPEGDATSADPEGVLESSGALHEKDSTPEATATQAVGLLTVEAADAESAQTDTAATSLVAVTDPADETAPSPPEPLSPLAELLQLPGRLVNAVLQVFDITTAADGSTTPINFQPINDVLFAAFRDLERLFGLDRTPTVQPEVPALTYTGSTTATTPTVAQFLNASTAAYGLGTTPGGLVPFTVNGFQMSSTNIFTGMSGKAWVTPEGQIIIAFQGTTGGTNLLFNPLMAISQVLTDLQVFFTNTTPLAFYGALRFTGRVEAEAAKQGYGFDDIFVTGHSLGGWEAQYVAQQTGLGGIGFETPGMNTAVPGNGADSLFVNIATYGDAIPYMSTDLPGLQPFMPAYEPGGGSKPHYGAIVMVGDPEAMTRLLNAATLWGRGLIGSLIFLVDYFGNFLQYHLPGVQAYHLDVIPDPGVLPWLGTASGTVNTGYGNLTIPQLLQAASDAGTLVKP